MDGQELRPELGYISCTALGDLDAALASDRAGNLAAAAALYERILARDGANFRALHLLGLVRHRLGDHTGAAGLIGRALSLRADFAEGHNDLGNCLRSAGRVDEARLAYFEAIRLASCMAEAYANLGLVYLQEDRFDKAWHLLSRATKLESNRPEFWEHLAELHERLDQFRPAIRCWERVLTLTPDHRARPHIALGRALKELNRPDEAAARYSTAVAVEPDSAEAGVELGEFLHEQGKFDQAEAAFRAALSRQPTNDLARARLASILLGTLPHNDVDKIVARLDDPGTGRESRARLLFALGQVYEARGEHSRAVSCLREANALNLALTPSHLCFQPAEHGRFVDGLIRAFGPDFFSRTAGAGLNTKRLVFIVGLPRSGTTLLEQILASHSRVYGAGELLLCRRLFDSIPTTLESTASPVDCVCLLDSQTVYRQAKTYLVRLRALFDDRADRVIDKMPENYLYLGLLTAMFPTATLIHCRRDLRDEALSCWTTDFRDIKWANDPGHIAANFHDYLRLMNHWRTVLPTTIHEVDYEELVADLEGVSRRLLAVMGLDWDPACLEFHSTRRTVRTASVTQVRKPLNTSSVGRWKRYEHELADLFAGLPPATGRLSWVPAPGDSSALSNNPPVDPVGAVRGPGSTRDASD